MDRLEIETLKESAIKFAGNNGYDGLEPSDLSLYDSQKGNFQGFLFNVTKGKEIWQYAIKPSLGGFKIYLQSKIETSSLEKVFAEKVLRDLEKQIPTLSKDVAKMREAKEKEQKERLEKRSRFNALSAQYFAEKQEFAKSLNITLTENQLETFRTEAISKAEKEVYPELVKEAEKETVSV